MLNENSIKVVAQNSSDGLCPPLYGSYCFSRIPWTVCDLLKGKSGRGLPADTYEGESYDMVILFFVDGFGWRFFEKYAERFLFLRRFLEKGIVSKLTSQFPSTTAGHVTCINTGLEVGESGVYEWFYYEPLVDRVIAPLLFSYAGDHKHGTLSESGIPSDRFYPCRTIYELLNEKGIDSYVLQNQLIAGSPYSEAMFRGAHQLPYASPKDAFRQLAALAEQPASNPTYAYLYFGEIDSAGHRQGIGSPQFETAVALIWNQMEEFFWQNLKTGRKKIACLVTADHGMVDVDPKTTLYINEKFPEIKRFIKRNRAGDLIAPAGSCRDFFFHIEEERLAESREVIQEMIQHRGRVVQTSELIEAGFFGERPVSNTFLERVGNLVILPNEGECIWWHEKHRFEQHFYGAHGGVSRHEMEIPFLFLSLS